MAIMKKAAGKYGWDTGGQWAALNTLEMHEAGYDNKAQNPSSTAYGMGQFLDTTWAGYGPKTDNATLQAEYMTKYVKDRYQTPENAWAKYYQHPGGVGWYEKGTSGAAPGWAVVGEHGAEMVRMRGGEQVLSHSATLASQHSGRGYAAGTGGGVRDLVFNAGSIQINYSGSPSDPGAATHNARETVRQIRKELSREDLVDKIATGVTH